MAPSILLLLPAVALSASLAYARPVACAPHGSHTSQGQAIADFTTAVNQYVELHRLLEDPLSALSIADPEQAARERRAHRAAIQAARATAQRGDVFTPRVSAYLRHQIQLTAREAGLTVTAPSGEWEAFGLPSAPLAINDAWPWATGKIPLAHVLGRLPELPDELEYRFAGRDLVLFDAEADLVVDVLEGALPLELFSEEEPGQDEPETCTPEPPPFIEGSPCDAHQELEMCWS